MGSRILIAEDELGIRTALTLLLEEEGYEITTVKDGEQAIEAIRAEHFDLVVSDIRMPGMNGLQLLDEIRKLPAAPEFVIITAYGSIETAIQALKNGARDFLLKPFSNELLKMTVARTLRLRELSEENTKLRELERMKKEFITMIAHELRTPLTAIKGYLKLVLSGMSGEIEPLQRDYLNVVRVNSEKLQSIINKMIDIGQLETSEFSLDLASTNTLSVIWEAIAEVQDAYEKKHLKLEVNLAASLRPIMVDPRRMKQIISSLLENAIAYSRPNQRLWLTVDRWKGPDSLHRDVPVSFVDFSDLEAIDYLEISVRDEGQGIPKEKLSRIFEKFYQVENLYTRQVGGLGIGLSLCKKLVEIMNGKIWASSREGEGSTFSFILPWRQASEITETVPDQPERPKESAA